MGLLLGARGVSGQKLLGIDVLGLFVDHRVLEPFCEGKIFFWAKVLLYQEGLGSRAHWLVGWRPGT